MNELHSGIYDQCKCCCAIFILQCIMMPERNHEEFFRSFFLSNNQVGGLFDGIANLEMDFLHPQTFALSSNYTCKKRMNLCLKPSCHYTAQPGVLIPSELSFSCIAVE